MAGELVMTAHAKVNLTLEVLGKRPDGFHEIRSVMQRISLADTLTIAPAEKLSLTCSDASLEGPENLVWRAAELLRSELDVTQGAALHLEKRIPAAAGLGGGSSDCAAALGGLIQLWGLSVSPMRLATLAATLGSDVPFFLFASGCALAEGRGEHISPLPALPPRWLVLVKPEAGISAGAAYGAVAPSDWSDGARTTAWLESAHASDVLPAPFNALERAALTVQPSADAARRALRDAGADAPIMSGSGSTFFALFSSEEAANQVAERVRKAGWDQVWVASFVTL
jgi:4-diphosphocytidyl-2-C-methyl-D-erythritol kinase